MIAELTPEQRWIFVGLLLLAGDSELAGTIYRRKDEDGNLLGYSDIVLADTLGVEENEIKIGLTRMIEKEKITVDPRGVVSICNWKKYQSDYERTKDAPSRCTNVQQSGVRKYALDLDLEKDRDKEEDKTIGLSGPLSESEINQKFDEFWKAYPREGRLAKKESRIKFGALVKRGEIKKFVRGFHGYIDYLKTRKLKDNFDQRPMYAKTFLNGRWQEFIEFKYEPEL